jgi:cytochrome c peroxidase
MNLFSKKSHLLCVTAFLTTSLFILSCQKDNNFMAQGSETVAPNATLSFNFFLNDAPNLPSTPFEYANINLPDHLATVQVKRLDNTPDNNRITNDIATLGRVLFYDKNLSVNNTTSCASCHKQSAAFSDPAVFSTGFDGVKTERNSMSLVNAGFYPNGRFLWDERAQSAENQASMPIVHAVEMGMPSIDALVDKLQKVPYYPNLYAKAFGTPTIDSARTVDAIAQFERSIISFRTKYDEGRARFRDDQNIDDTDFPNFTAQENLGKQIFFGRGNCSRCHANETFSMINPKNIGLDVALKDNGIGAITGRRDEEGVFKVPSLKSVALSAPYMHDGRFSTLEEVVEHYNSGVRAHPNLSSELVQRRGRRNTTVVRLNLSQAEKQALVAFLETLTDTGITNDPKFSDPFLANSVVNK